MAVKGIPIYEYKKYGASNVQEFNVTYENSQVVVESDDFVLVMDLECLDEIRGKLNGVWKGIV